MSTVGTVQYRERYRHEFVPESYSGYRHMFATNAICLSILVVAAIQIHSTSMMELMAAPLTFIYANYSEYDRHKGPSHHPRGWLKFLYERHTIQHHGFFTDELMTYDTSQDFKVVLFPVGLVLFYVSLLLLPEAGLMAILISTNVAAIFAVTAILCFMNLDWMHFYYHLADDSKLAKALSILPFARAMKANHILHHNPRMMSKYNFNITYPIFDYFFGTLYREEQADSLEAKRSET
jgi:hypothetical protein